MIVFLFLSQYINLCFLWSLQNICPLWCRFQDTKATFDVAKAGQESVTTIGTATPVDDFHILVSKGMIDEAVEGMKEAVCGVVDLSIGSRSYHKALQALIAFRKGCVENSKVLEFNHALCHLRDRYKVSSTRSEFWGQVLEEKVTLIHTGEVACSNIIPLEAQEFLTAGTQALVTQKEDMEVVDDDEFEGME